MFRFLTSFITLLVLGWLVGSCQFFHDSLFTLVPSDESGITFANRLTEKDTVNILGIDYFYNGGGTAIGDFDNDGRQDIFFSGNMVANRLYLNKGDFKFTDVTTPAGVGGNGKWCSGVALVDINNDGWMDIYVGSTIKPNSRYR